MSVTLYAVQVDCRRLMWSDPGTSHGYTSLFKATSMYRLLHVTVTPADVKSLGPKMIKRRLEVYRGLSIFWQKSRVYDQWKATKYGKRLYLSD